jgi:hypothetical protein
LAVIGFLFFNLPMVLIYAAVGKRGSISLIGAERASGN